MIVYETLTLLNMKIGIYFFFFFLKKLTIWCCANENKLLEINIYSFTSITIIFNRNALCTDTMNSSACTGNGEDDEIGSWNSILWNQSKRKKSYWRQSADYIRGCKTQMHYNFIISLKQFFFASHSLASYSIWFLSSLCYFILHFAMWRNCIQFFGANHKRWIHPVHHVHYSIYIFGFVVLSEIDMSEEN